MAPKSTTELKQDLHKHKRDFELRASDEFFQFLRDTFTTHSSLLSLLSTTSHSNDTNVVNDVNTILIIRGPLCVRQQVVFETRKFFTRDKKIVYIYRS